MDTELLFSKINYDRAEQFQIVTRICEDSSGKYVLKQALTPEAVAHLKRMYDYETGQQQGKLQPLAGQWLGDGIRYPFLEEANLDELLEQDIASSNKEAAIEKMQAVLNALEAGQKLCKAEDVFTEEFKALFGEEILSKEELLCVNPANLDLILANIFVQKDVYRVIDCEWCFYTWVPVEFLRWRIMNELLVNHVSIRGLFTREELRKIFQIEESNQGVFQNWNKYFTESFVGANSLRNEILQELLENERYKKLPTKQQECQSTCVRLYLAHGEDDIPSLERELFKEVPINGDSFETAFDLTGQSFDRILIEVSDAMFGRIKLWANDKRLYTLHKNLGGELNLGEEEQDRDSNETSWDEFTTKRPIYLIEKCEMDSMRIVLRGQIQKQTMEEIEQEYVAMERDRFSAREYSNKLEQQLHDIYNNRLLSLCIKIFGKH